MDVFTKELAELQKGHAAASGAVLVQYYQHRSHPGEPFTIGFPMALIAFIIGLVQRHDLITCLAVFPPSANTGDKAAWVVPVDWPADMAPPTSAERAEFYGVLSTGHAVAFDVRSQLVFPIGPAVRRKRQTPKLKIVT